MAGQAYLPRRPMVRVRALPGRRSSGIELAARARELGRLLVEARREGRLVVDPALARDAAHVLGDLHRAELRPAHRAEVRALGAVLGQRRVVVLARGLGIEPELELVLPAEREPRARERVVAQLRARVTLGEIRGVRRDLVGDHALLDVVAVGQPEVLL